MGVGHFLKIAAVFLFVGLAGAQEWSLQELQERTQSREKRLQEIREYVFKRYGKDLGYKSADEVPLEDTQLAKMWREQLETQKKELQQKQKNEAEKRKKLDEEERKRLEEEERVKLQALERAISQAKEEERRLVEEERRKKEALERTQGEEAKRKALEAEQPFNEALALFRRGEYKEAYERFIKLYFERREDVSVAFYTGRSAFETENYEVAVGAYEQALSIDSKHRRARLELARTYFVMGMTKEARFHFNLVLEEGGDLPPEVRRNIQAYLEAIEALQKRHHLSGQLVGGLGYDSNVNQGNDYLPAGLEAYFDDPLNPAKSDSFMSLVSFNTHRYDFGEEQGWQWQSDLLLFSNTYSQESAQNILLFGLQTGPLLDSRAGRLRLPVGYDKVWVDGEAYMNITSFTTAFERPFAKRHLGKFFIKRIDRSNVDSANQERDATGMEAGVDWQYLFTDKKQLANLGFGITQETPKRGDRPDAEFNALGLRGSYTYLMDRWSAGGSAQLKQIEYPTPFIDVDASTISREDTQIVLALSATRTLAPDLTLSSQLTWLKNGSTYDAYRYDKTTLQINLGWNWGI